MGAALAAQKPEIEDQSSEVGGQRADSQKPEIRNGDQAAAEEAEVAIKTGAVAANEDVAPPAPDDEGYVWPEDAQQVPHIAAPVPTNGTTVEADAPLPALDDLLKRIPADVRETLDDLFRARFVSVKPVRKASLK